jgi:hypothetical protein
MPYSVGAEGSHGCSGYPVIKIATGEVMGCHPSVEDANKQLAALHINEPETTKVDGDGAVTGSGINPSYTTSPNYPGVGIKYPDVNPRSSKRPKRIRGVRYGTSADANNSVGAFASGGSGGSMGAAKAEETADLIKEQGPCWDGYAQRGMKPGDNGKMVPNCVPVKKMNDLWEDDDSVVYETDSINKADGYVPPASVRAAAKKAIKFKDAGKAHGAGTAVGWTRAGQLSRGETISLSTVKRMYSYFSRHEVDKKGKDWANQAKPSHGYVMWLAWGGDAGYSWSRGIVEREAKKMDNEIWAGSAFSKRDYSTAARHNMAAHGTAMADGSYPIANATDLHNAIQSFGRASDPEAVKAHIKTRARALGLTDQLPDSWK